MRIVCPITPRLPFHRPAPETWARARSRYRSRACGRRALARRSSRSGGGLRSERGRCGSGVPLLLLGLDELTIVRRIEVEQRPTRREVLDENLADHVGGAGGE